MAIVYYGGTVLECLSTDTLPAMPDGWIAKVVDAGLSYIRINGAWQFINLGFAFVKATKSGISQTDGTGTKHIVFSQPFSVNDISVMLCCEDTGSLYKAYYYTVSNTGFWVVTRKIPSGAPQANVKFSWIATRRYDPT